MNDKLEVVWRKAVAAYMEVLLEKFHHVSDFILPDSNPVPSENKWGVLNNKSISSCPCSQGHNQSLRAARQEWSQGFLYAKLRMTPSSSNVYKISSPETIIRACSFRDILIASHLLPVPISYCFESVIETIGCGHRLDSIPVILTLSVGGRDWLSWLTSICVTSEYSNQQCLMGPGYINCTNDM